MKLSRSQLEKIKKQAKENKKDNSDQQEPKVSVKRQLKKIKKAVKKDNLINRQEKTFSLSIKKGDLVSYVASFDPEKKERLGIVIDIELSTNINNTWLTIVNKSGVVKASASRIKKV